MATCPGCGSDRALLEYRYHQDRLIGGCRSVCTGCRDILFGLFGGEEPEWDKQLTALHRHLLKLKEGKGSKLYPYLDRVLWKDLSRGGESVLYGKYGEVFSSYHAIENGMLSMSARVRRGDFEQQDRVLVVEALTGIREQLKVLRRFLDKVEDSHARNGNENSITYRS